MVKAMKKRIKSNYSNYFMLAFLLMFWLMPYKIYMQTFEMVDNFETHNWHWYQWGSDNGFLSYSNIWSSQGDFSLKLTSTKNNTGWNIFGTGCMEIETPDSILIDVYAINTHRLEIKIVNSNNQEILLDAINMAAGVEYLNWKIDVNGNNIRKLYLVQAWYEGTVTVYIDNIRFYKNGVETKWEGFEQPSYYWDGSADADNKDNQVIVSDDITHSYSSQNFGSTASQVLQWDDSIYQDDHVAQLQTNFDQPKDWSKYYYFRLDVYRPSSTPDCSLFVFIWDGTNGIGTEWVNVPADEWTTVTLKLGGNINLSNIEEVKIVVPNTDIYTTGKLFLDNFQVGGFVPLTTPKELSSIGVRYSLDDFDGRIPDQFQKDSVARAGYNDYFGYTGTAKSSNAQLDVSLSNIENNGHAHTKPFAWQIAYDVSYDINSWISYWNLLGPGEAPKPRDMSNMEKFSLWIKGDTSGFSDKICVEFHDARWGNPDYNSGKAFAVLSNISSEWKQWIIPFDPDSLVIYGNFDPTKVTEVVISLDNSTASRSFGKFYIDDLQFVDTDEVYWNNNDFNEDFLDLVERRTFNYFNECVNDITGLVFDRANFLDLATVAGTGFGLGATVVAVERGWISSEEAENYIIKVLSGLWSSPQDTSVSGTSGYKGFYYHFLESDSGLRKQVPPDKEPVELSVVDTGILMAGILLVREYFKDNQTIVDLAEKLYRRVDWTWFYDISVNQFYLGWSPEKGFVGHWDVFTDEVMLINILAVGSPTHPVPSNCFYAWSRDIGTYNNHTIVNSWNGSLFQYFFTHCWIDLHDKTDAQGINWFNNSIEAGYANRDYCIAGIDGSGRTNVPTYGMNGWGLSATEQIPAGIDTIYFGENGALPTKQSNDDPNFNGTFYGENNGTVPVYGAGSMIGFASYSDGFDASLVYDALKNYYLNTQLWTGNFGFRDSYTDTSVIKSNAWSKFPMYKNNFFAIDQGPMLLMIENFRSKLIWNYLKNNEYIATSLNELFVQDLRVNDDLTGASQLWPATASNYIGKYVTVWDDRRVSNTDFIYVQEFHSIDNGIGKFRVDGINRQVTSIDSVIAKPKVAINGNNRYLITWFENNNLLGKLFMFGDTVSGTEFKINELPIYSNEQTSALTSGRNNNFVVAWTGVDDEKDIFIQIIDSLGNKVGSNIKVNDDVSNNEQTSPDICMADDGTFLVVWQDTRNNNNEIFAQLYFSDGIPNGSNFKISGEYGCSIKPSADMNSNGDFVITWLDTTSSNRNIYASLYDKNGVLQKGILTVSTNSYSPAICKPDVAIDSVGNFNIVWQDSREGSMDIYYQQYSFSGTPIGGNSRVHSQRLESNQINPVIISLGSNRGYQIVWQDDRNGDWDIYCPIINFNDSKDFGNEKNFSEIPLTYELTQNYPNPFNPTTTINFSLPKAQNVKVVIYDLLGNEVKVLINEFKKPGYHKIMFNASNLASGIYIYRIIAGDFMQSKKMVLLK